MSTTDPLMKRAAARALDLFRLKIFRRARSYRAVFTPDDGLDRDREIVLADLRDFCRAGTSTFDPDPCSAARLQGRREVWLRISQHLNLDEGQVQKLVEIDDGVE